MTLIELIQEVRHIGAELSAYADDRPFVMLIGPDIAELSFKERAKLTDDRKNKRRYDKVVVVGNVPEVLVLCTRRHQGALLDMALRSGYGWCSVTTMEGPK